MMQTRWTPLWNCEAMRLERRPSLVSLRDCRLWERDEFFSQNQFIIFRWVSTIRLLQSTRKAWPNTHAMRLPSRRRNRRLTVNIERPESCQNSCHSGFDGVVEEARLANHLIAIGVLRVCADRYLPRLVKAHLTMKAV